MVRPASQDSPAQAGPSTEYLSCVAQHAAATQNRAI